MDATSEPISADVDAAAPAADTGVLDAVIVGAGAAGLMTAIVAGRERPGIRLALLEGGPRAGTKILVSGGGRCNVTNRVVTPADFHGDRKFVTKVLGRFGAARTPPFFEELGVELKHEPEFDKLFPVTDSAHTIRNALVAECERVGAPPRLHHRVTGIARDGETFVVSTPLGDLRTRRVVLATGGRSLPRTGSDGFGYELVKALGHTVTATVPGLVPLRLDPNPLAGLDGIALPVEIRVHDREDGRDRVVARVTGPMLVTHFGISGPAALDVSRHWAVAAERGRRLELRLSFAPGREAADVEKQWLAESLSGGGRPVVSLLAGFPRRVIERILDVADVRGTHRLGELSRAARQSLLAAFTALPLPVSDTRGFNAAEVTAGGVPVSEVDPRTMESKLCPGLHLVGEILDVEGRLGGFNFQWAWATGHVCGQALAVAAAGRRATAR